MTLHFILPNDLLYLNATSMSTGTVGWMQRFYCSEMNQNLHHFISVNFVIRNSFNNGLGPHALSQNNAINFFFFCGTWHCLPTPYLVRWQRCNEELVLYEYSTHVARLGFSQMLYAFISFFFFICSCLRGARYVSIPNKAAMVLGTSQNRRTALSLGHFATSHVFV